MVAELVLLTVLALLLAALWALRLDVPRCEAVPADAAAVADISVLIPARNEAHNLPALLHSIRSQHETPREVIVVDDASEDDTAAVARRAGARVIRVEALPAGWRGKPWACHQAARAAGGAHFLFLDADTRLVGNRALARLRAALPDDGVLSVLPYHRMRRCGEQFSAIFNLLMAAGVGAVWVRGRASRSTGLFGPFMLIGRDLYARCGGHAAVRGETLENLCLAERIQALGAPVRVRAGRGTIEMRMYPGGLPALTRGWAKAFAQGAARTSRRVMAAVSAWIGMAWILAGALSWAMWRPGAPLRQGAWCALYLLFALHLWRGLRRLGNYAVLAALAYPVMLGFYLAVFAVSARIAAGKSTIRWKGRRLDNGPAAPAP